MVYMPIHISSIHFAFCHFLSFLFRDFLVIDLQKPSPITHLKHNNRVQLKNHLYRNLSL
jgi:hypothetical protein